MVTRRNFVVAERTAANESNAPIALFASEAERGINSVYLAGGEPALQPRRLALAAKHIGCGTIFNGTVRINPALTFTIHVSLRGGIEDTVRLRGGSSYEEAFRNFGTNPRARFVYTLNAQISRACEQPPNAAPTSVSAFPAVSSAQPSNGYGRQPVAPVRRDLRGGRN